MVVLCRECVPRSFTRAGHRPLCLSLQWMTWNYDILIIMDFGIKTDRSFGCVRRSTPRSLLQMGVRYSKQQNALKTAFTGLCRWGRRPIAKERSRGTRRGDALQKRETRPSHAPVERCNKELEKSAEALVAARWSAWGLGNANGAERTAPRDFVSSSGRTGGDRTRDPNIKSVVLYQLSYSPRSLAA